MQEVSGPVIGIALILAAVFIPVGVMSGIQGRLNQQFAITIAVSVHDLGVQRADAVAGAVGDAAAAAQADARSARPLLRSSSTAWLERATHGYISLSHGLIRKPLIGVAHARAVRAVGGRARLAAADAASCRKRTTATRCSTSSCRRQRRSSGPTRWRARVDAILKKTEGVRNFNTIIGFSLLTRVTASNNAFYFVQFQPWDERHDPRCRRARSSIAERRAADGDTGSDGLRDHAAVDSRSRQPGRLLALAAGSQRRLDRFPERQPAEVPGRGATSGRSSPA